MQLAYVKLYADTRGAVEMLSDAEAGRLFKAIFNRMAGKEANLQGNERLVYAMLDAQFERDAAQYETFISKQRKNGKKGGRPKKAMGLSENPENPTVFLKTQKSQDKDKDKDKDVTPYNPPSTAEAYARCYLSTMTAGNLAEFQTFADDFPQDVLKYAVDIACGNGKGSYAYVRKILNNWLGKGIFTLDEARADNERRRDVPAEAYNPYTDPDFWRLHKDD